MQIIAAVEPVGLSAPARRSNRTPITAPPDQEAPASDAPDGMHYFARNGSTADLPVMNHGIRRRLTAPDSMKTWTAKGTQAQAAHGSR